MHSAHSLLHSQTIAIAIDIAKELAEILLLLLILLRHYPELLLLLLLTIFTIAHVWHSWKLVQRCLLDTF